MTETTSVHLYDDAFSVDTQRWGTFVSYDLEGQALITALTEEQCVASTRWYLKQKQEGFTNDDPTYNGVVGGKL